MLCGLSSLLTAVFWLLPPPPFVFSFFCLFVGCLGQVVVLHGGRMAFAGSFPQLQEATSAHAQLQVAPSHPVPPGGAQGPDTDSSAGAGAGAGAGTSESKHTEGTAAVVTATPRSGRGQTLGEVMAMLSHVIRDETQQRRGRATSVASSQSDGGSALARQVSWQMGRSGCEG